MSRRIFSPISLVSPYGLVAPVAASSRIGSVSGLPYTVALELKTMRLTSCARIAAAQRQQAADVVGVVAQRLLRRLAHRLERREVHDGVDAMAREHAVHRVGVADARALEHRRLAGQLLAGD